VLYFISVVVSPSICNEPGPVESIMSHDIKMFPSLDMAEPTDAVKEDAVSARKARKSTKPKLPGQPKTSLESRQLPGLLSTLKPSNKPTSSGNDKSVMVGFNATNMKFDGEDIKYADKVLGKTQPSSSKGKEPATLATTNLNDNQVDRLKNKHAAPATGKNKGDLIVDELRNYTMLMDTFSLHNFVIYQGETLKNTPEFQSFRRQYSHEWGSISHLIGMLESIMVEFLVKLAIINGPELYALASLNKAVVSKDEVLACISNIDQIRPNLRSNVAKGDGEEVSFWQQFRAIVKMQSLVRKFLSARRVRRIRMQLMGCIRIQAHLRKVIYRKFGMARLKNDRQELNDRFNSTAAKLLANYQRQEALIDSRASGPKRSVFNANKSMATGTLAQGDGGQRLLIHVPGISAEEYLRLEFEGWEAMQNAHIGCLHQLVDPEVSIIYVTPVPISAELEAYYDKFLGMMGVTTLPRRLHFIYPESIKRLPQHMPLAQVLWCSSVAVRKIKQHIRRIPNAIIVPGSITWIERRLCTMFNVPLLSAEPVIVEHLKNRSFIKKVFMDAKINIPIGAHDIHSQDDLFIALSRLISSNLDVNRWIIRLNMDANNEATVILDVHKLQIVHELRLEQAKLIEQNGNSGSWFSRQVQSSVRKRILAVLKTGLDKQVKICRKDIYPSWPAFADRMHRIGGVVEADPIEKLGYVDGMCFVSSTGRVTFFAGLDVFVDDRLQVQTCMGPQTAIPTKALVGATEAMATFLHQKWKFVGYLTVKFLAFWDGLDDIPRLWGVGVHCGHSPQWGSFGTAAVAMNPLPYFPDHIVPLPIPDFSHNAGTDFKLASGKFCLFIPMMYHEPLKGTRDDAFFKFCIMRGIAFDKIDKTGILFFLVDSVIGGRLSFISVANSRFRALEQAINAITYISQQFGKDGAGRNVTDLASVLLGLKKAFKAEERMAGPLAM